MNGKNHGGGIISSGKRRTWRARTALLLLGALLALVAVLVIVQRERKKTIMPVKETTAVVTQHPLQQQAQTPESEAEEAENPATHELTSLEKASGHHHARHPLLETPAGPSTTPATEVENYAVTHHPAKHPMPETPPTIPSTTQAAEGERRPVPVAPMTPSVADITKTPAAVEEQHGVSIGPMVPAAGGEPGPGAAPTSGMPQARPIGDCAGDTIAPWVYPDPAAGLHYGKLKIVFQTNKFCTVLWRRGADTGWVTWTGDSIAIDNSVALSFKAIDNCGRTIEPRIATYEIKPARKMAPCPEGMVPVETGSQQFCIDRYEWPDRKGVVPRSYVSIYQAMDSCATRGKRLCSADEWSAACAGPDSLTYPYGRVYERYACVTHDTTARRSGSRSSCRSYFGAFDMAGNLAEWTTTPSKKNPRFFEVMGGMWASGPASGCYNARYSYFPQNRHNPVGFRCCKEIVESGK